MTRVPGCPDSRPRGDRAVVQTDWCQSASSVHIQCRGLKKFAHFIMYQRFIYVFLQCTNMHILCCLYYCNDLLPHEELTGKRNRARETEFSANWQRTNLGEECGRFLELSVFWNRSCYIFLTENDWTVTGFRRICFYRWYARCMASNNW